MLFVATSTTADGLMKSPDMDYRTVLPARRAFLHTHDIDASDTTLVQVTYETDNFCRYETLADVDRGDGITRVPTYEADALVVTQPGHALLLPLADCIGAVIHDSQRNILMLSHLGRQNLEQLGGTRCIEYLIDRHDCDPHALAVWLSPAAGADSYPLYAFENRSLHDVASEQLQAGGIPAANISVSPIDSAADTNYFSHSQYLRGNRKTDGRHAVVAYIA